MAKESNYNGPIPEHEVYLPLEAYSFRILSAEKKVSNNTQLNMLVLEVEITEAPDLVQSQEGSDEVITFSPNGIKLMHYVMLEGKDERDTAKRLADVNKLLTTLELPNIVSHNEINPEQFVGLIIKGTAVSKEKPVLSEVTKKPILNPYTDEPKTQKRHEITGLFYNC